MSGKTVLITGAAGQLGRELVRASWPEDFRIVATDRSQLDITDRSAVCDLAAAIRPDVIVNAAAYTDVDRAEREPGLADAVNRAGVACLAEAADEAGARLIQISTDYVFDGRKQGWYVESDPVDPTTVYGKTKAAGEESARRIERHLILRTAWVYGSQGSNFVTKILRAAEQREKLRVVDDQTGCPSGSHDLAAAIVRLVAEDPARELKGTYHLAGPLSATWFEFACGILAALPATRAAGIEPIRTADSHTRAPRPANSRLDSTALFSATGIALQPWREALPEVLGELAVELRPRERDARRIAGSD